MKDLDFEIVVTGEDFEEAGRRIDFEVVSVDKSILVAEIGGELTTALPLDHFGPDNVADETWIGQRVQLLKLRVKQEKVDKIAEKLENGWTTWELV